MAETAEQTRLRLLAIARQREGEAVTQSNGPDPLLDASGPRPDPVKGWATTKELVRGAGEGVAALPGLPDQILTGLENVPRRIQNATAANEALYAPKGSLQPAPVQLLEPNNPWRETYNRNLPPDPNHPEARKIGNIVGAKFPAIVAPELLAGDFAALPAAALDAAVTTGTTYGFGKGGRLIDQSLGGSGDTGEFWGSLFGGGVTPAAMNAASRLTTDANSVARFNDARLAGVKEPDLSLVGNDFASRWGSKSNQAVQQGQIDATLRDVATERRGAPAPGPISRADVGQGVVNAAQQGAERAAADAETAYRAGIAGKIDQNAPIVSEAPALQALSANAEPAFQQPLIDEYQKAVDASRMKDAATAPRLLDRNAQAGLEADVALRQNALDRLTQARADPAKIAAAEADLAQAKGALDANLGTTFNDIKVRRGDVRARLDSGEGDPFILGKIHDAQTEAMRSAAMQRGITSEEFDAVNQRYADMKTVQSELEKLANAKEAPAYGQVFGPSGEQSPSTLRALQQNADPSALSTILANNFELKTRGPTVAGRPELPRDVGLNPRAPDWWDAAPEEVRRAYATTPAIRDRIDAAMRTIRADARRGGSQIEGPDIVTPAAFGAAATGHPVAALAAMTPRVGSALAGGFMRNPRFTEAMIARRANPLTIRDLARTMAASVGAR